MVKERIKQHRCMGEFIYLKVSAAVGKKERSYFYLGKL